MQTIHMSQAVKQNIAYQSIHVLNATLIANLDLEEAKEIYYADFSLPNKCSILPHAISKKLFALSVNVGLKQAAKILQRATRSIFWQMIEEDGKALYMSRNKKSTSTLRSFVR